MKLCARELHRQWTQRTIKSDNQQLLCWNSKASAPKHGQFILPELQQPLLYQKIAKHSPQTQQTNPYAVKIFDHELHLWCCYAIINSIRIDTIVEEGVAGWNIITIRNDVWRILPARPGSSKWIKWTTVKECITTRDGNLILAIVSPACDLSVHCKEVPACTYYL